MLILGRRVLENYFLDDAVLVARMKRHYGLCLRKALQPLLAPALTSGSAMVSKTYSPCEIPEVGEKISKCQKGICHPEFISGSHIEIPKQVRNDKKVKAAFTLAEVLITLAIIGIVAAMTIPTLVANYTKKVTATKVKKVFAELNQVVRLSEVENGPMNFWDFETPESIDTTRKFLVKYILPYYKNYQECGTGGDYTCGMPVSRNGVNYFMDSGVGLSFVPN